MSLNGEIHNAYNLYINKNTIAIKKKQKVLIYRIMEQNLCWENLKNSVLKVQKFEEWLVKIHIERRWVLRTQSDSKPRMKLFSKDSQQPKAAN